MSDNDLKKKKLIVTDKGQTPLKRNENASNVSSDDISPADNLQCLFCVHPVIAHARHHNRMIMLSLFFLFQDLVGPGVSSAGYSSGKTMTFDGRTGSSTPPVTRV